MALRASGAEVVIWEDADSPTREDLLAAVADIDGMYAHITNMVDAEVMDAYKEEVKFGDLANGPHQEVETIFTEVYEEMPWHLKEQRDEAVGE